MVTLGMSDLPKYAVLNSPSQAANSTLGLPLWAQPMSYFVFFFFYCVFLLHNCSSQRVFNFPFVILYLDNSCFSSLVVLSLFAFMIVIVFLVST